MPQYLAETSALRWLAYGIGGLGILVEWRSYRLTSAHSFRCWSATGAVLWAAQYMLLQAWTASLIMACTALRTMLSEKYQHGPAKHIALIGFGLLFSLLTVFSWQGMISLLPAFAVLNTTLALFYLDNRLIRMTLLLSSIAWIGNDLYWQAWPALLAESVAMLINGYTIKKLFNTPQEQTLSE